MKLWTGMETWKKATLIAGTIAAIAGIGGIIGYSLMKGKKKTPPKKEEKKEIHPKEPIKPPIKPKPIIVQIFEEAITDTMEAILKYSQIISQMNNVEAGEKENIIEEAQNQVQELFGQHEEAACQRLKIDFEEYYEEVSDNTKNGQIIPLSTMLDTMQDDMIKGKKPSFRMELSPELTKEKTLKLYKWIMLSHLHLFQKEIQKLVNKKGDISKIEIKALEDSLKEVKNERRNKLLEWLKISKSPNEEYRYLMQKAYYTYLTNNPDFEEEMNYFLAFYALLEEKVSSKTYIPELHEDPQFLTEKQVDILLKELQNKYHT